MPVMSQECHYTKRYIKVVRIKNEQKVLHFMSNRLLVTIKRHENLSNCEVSLQLHLSDHRT